MRRRGLVFLIAMLMVASAGGQYDPAACRVDDHLLRADELQGGGLLREAMVQLDSAERLVLATGDDVMLIDVFRRKAVVMQAWGDYDRALDHNYQALRVAEVMDDRYSLAEVQNNIGSIHHYQGSLDLAEEYYRKSLEIWEELRNRRGVARLLNNLGSLHEDRGEIEEALSEHRKSLAVWQDLQDTIWMAVSFANLASCHQALGDLDRAMELYQRSLALQHGGPRNYLLGRTLVNLGGLRLDRGDIRGALRDCGEGGRIGEDLASVPLKKESCYCRYQAFERIGRPLEALQMYQAYISYRDSLFGQDKVREITRLALVHEYDKQALADSLHREEERLRTEFAYASRLARQRSQRNILLLGGGGVFLLAVGLWSRLRFVRRSRTVIQRERERSDDLLRNILPVEVAEELKTSGVARARQIDRVTVLFTDFKGFTAISEQLGPQELVRGIHEAFSAFDRIVRKHGVEKIKTIGDAYMAAGGVPVPNATHARDVVAAALEIRDFIEAEKHKAEVDGRPWFEVRIGVHTGPVVAGVVGLHKFQYDIWGDTVNTASRMESSGEPGQVNISEATHACVKGDPGLRFTPRGRVQAKGKGELEMFFVHRSDEVA